MKKIVLTLCCLFGLIGVAQAYPNRPIQLIVPFNAGGSLDSMTRIVAEYMKEELRKPITVINRPGASGTIGINAYFKMKNDGHTVLVFPTSSFFAPVFQGRDAFDASRLVPVGSFFKSERILFSRSDAPYKSFEELVAYAKEHPGELKFGSGGDTATAYVFRNIARKSGLDINVTLFNGGAPAAAAIMGGHVDLVEGGNGSPADTAATAGKLIRLNILSDGKLELYPELKNPLEMGFEYASSIMFALFLHNDAPKEAQVILENALQKALQNKGLQDKFAHRGLTPAFYPGNVVKKSISSASKACGLYKELGSL